MTLEESCNLAVTNSPRTYQRMKNALHLKLPRTTIAQRLLGNRARVVAALRALWAAHEETPAEVEIIFVDEPTIQKLHDDYLHDASSTDIITFDLGVSPEGARLGALYICPEVAKRFAARYKVTLGQELHRLIAHGILHLLGYDDHSPQDKRRMRREENKILARINRAA